MDQFAIYCSESKAAIYFKLSLLNKVTIKMHGCQLSDLIKLNYYYI